MKRRYSKAAEIDEKLYDLVHNIYPDLVDLQKELQNGIEDIQGLVASGTPQSFVIGQLKTVNAQLQGALRTLEDL
jgi:hypothetical protein